MKTTAAYALAATAALLTGCFKEVSRRTDYVLKPLVQELSVDPAQPLEGARAYAFAADTAFYAPASYEDALAGILTRKDDPSVRIAEPVAAAEPYALDGTVGWLHMPLSGASRAVVLVDPTHRLYAYTQQALAENLPQLYVSVAFKPWKEGFSYQDGAWSFYNRFYTPPTYLACTVEARVQREEEGPEAAVPSLKAYAYAVDTTQWGIASYEDALAGRITSKSDPEQTRSQPNFQAYEDKTSGRYVMEVSAATLLVVVIDRTDRLYAYTQQSVDLEGAPAAFPPVVFRPWRRLWIDTDRTDGWVLVDDRYAPQTPSVASPHTLRR